MTEAEKQILSEYIPSGALEEVVHLIVRHKIHLKITQRRTTKLGDYRPPSPEAPYHRISINHDLNPYSFLITFIHETAHLLVYKRFRKKKVQPHGKEWKTFYRQLMQRFLDKEIFPPVIKAEIEKSITNSKASTHSEINLTRALQAYDRPPAKEGVVTLETLPEGTVFITENGRIYKKGKKRRVRYMCMNLQNKRWYLFHPLTPVLPDTQN